MLISTIGWIHIKQFLKDIRFHLVFEEKNYSLVEKLKGGCNENNTVMLLVVSQYRGVKR